MILHLGANTSVLEKEIIGVFDMDSTTVSKKTRDYLSRAEKEKNVVNVSYELPKSFIVCSPVKKKENKVYISPISVQTLSKRSEL